MISAPCKGEVDPVEPKDEAVPPEAPTTTAQPDALAPLAEEADTGPADADQALCAICTEDEKSHTLVPCGHRCLCGRCSEAIADKQCPVCRQGFVAVLRVFL
jgi:hypothetical protein